MAVFASKPYRPVSPSSAYQQTVAAKYRRLLPRHPFLLFGLPFLTTIVAASFLLTPATAIRYEKHDRKVRRMSEDEALGLGKDSRRIGGEGGKDTMREEYYRLAAKDLDNWENKRVERLKGEPDGILK